ncbi:MAG TPA: C39 family peptidase [Solirubrobacterales bacterium]|nr:C39 family peptidase [Solirubrobacterales bacterium]
MTPPRSGATPRRRVVVRRRVTALTLLVAGALALGVAIAGLGGGSAGSPPSPAFVRIELEGQTVARRKVSELRSPRSLAAMLSEVPASRTVHRGPATFHLHVERGDVPRAVERAVRNGGGAITVREQPVATRIRVPIVKQALQDNCEAAALSMVLAYSGKPVGQLALQSQVAHSPPLDPTVAANGSEVWGDPSQGFVGRADGGGPAGGFGVYQGPIQALARRHGVVLHDLTDSSPAAVYEALLRGHPVMVWVALSNGPFATWSSPSGQSIRVNYGEHALVLTGVDPADVRVNDPLSGTRLTWSKPQFEQMWKGLGRRALSA